MKPEFRIKENKKYNPYRFEVYFVEYKGFLFKKEVLKPFITYAGTGNIYPFSSIETAITELKQEVIKQTERL